MARIVKAQGSVEFRRSEYDPWIAVSRNDSLCEGTIIQVGPRSRATIVLLSNDELISLDQGTTIRLGPSPSADRPVVEVVFGIFYHFSRSESSLSVLTRFFGIGVDGTEFLVRVGLDRAEVVMLSGAATVSNPLGQVSITSGDGASARLGEAPRRQAIVRPRDAVTWALYYPPVQPELVDGGDLGSLSASLKIALLRARKNDYEGAFKTLDQAPEGEQDARHDTFRAGLLLEIGRTGEALVAIERALDKDPNAAGAYAQRSMIRVVGNQPKRALEDADRAVALAPAMSTALIAQSYARQANFDLEGARESLRLAVEKNPNDALAFARLSEIELSFGDLDRAGDDADRAARLAPYFGRTQMVKGFAELHKIDIDGAIDAFDRAIALDQAEPLSRLGLGLAKIRRGDLEAGRQEIELAAALAPNNSLIRSYLGKAYFEEKQGEPAAEEYALAKDLDPNDPTPWFYDAIRKQLDNRPVEALRDLEQAIDLNDNRAVYRSRLLLDQDRATRSTSLARIYDDLGFDQLAVNEASKSLSRDPSNHSAHRFLSDAYARLPRHEIARVSELLQAQLLQPLNINPVPPSLPLTDLNAVASVGPAEPAFNEYNPLFERNQTKISATALVGNNDTFADEITVSAIHDRFSASIGQYHSETDGFRKNNDVDNDLYNAFGQIALSPYFNIQAEYRRRETAQGDLVLNFDPNDILEERRRKIEQDTARFGLRYSPSAGVDFIGSAFYVNRDEEIVDRDISANDAGYQIETQALLGGDGYNVLVGHGTYDTDVEEPSGKISKSKQDNYYIYTNLNFAENVIWTLGFSLDDIQRSTLDINTLNPKFGLQWSVTDDIRLRLAAFKVVKPALVAEQTIEPTQIAGFSQFFDDLNGTESRRVGAGLDIHLAEGLYGGIEVSHRDADDPSFLGSDDQLIIEDINERLSRAYLYWTLSDRWSISAQYLIDEFERDERLRTIPRPRPVEVKTETLPISIAYYDPVGFFSKLTGTLVHQEINKAVLENIAGSPVDDSDTFFLLDMAVGYRLPKRRGVLSIEAKNLLGASFQFQDNNFRTSERRRSRFEPESSIIARCTFTF